MKQTYTARLAPSSTERSRAVWDALLLAAIAAVYAAFCSRTFYWDGVSFALAIESVYRGESPFGVLFHPNHLLYNVFGYGLYTGAQALGLHARAITLLQYANLIFSLCCGYLVYRIARRLAPSAETAYACWLLFSFGALWWHYSTDADAYILATLLLTISFFCLLQRQLRFWILAGLFHVLAMLCHELSVFFYVPVLTAILRNQSWTLRTRVAVSVTYVVSTAGLVGCAYYLCYCAAGAQNTMSLGGWISSRAEDAHFRFSLRTVIGSNLDSYVKLFVGGKLSFLQEYFSVPLVLGLLIAFLGIVFWIVRWRRDAGTPAVPDRRKRDAYQTALLSWLLIYALFLSVWLPWNGFYKLFLWPALALLLGYWAPPRRWLPLVVALAGWNFAAYIFPHTHVSADPVLELAERINKELPQNATVYYRQFVTDDWYLRYFAPGRAWKPLPNLQTGHAANLLAPYSTVCFETSALSEIRSQHSAEDQHLLSLLNNGLHWNLISPKYDVELRCARPTGALEAHSKSPDLLRPAPRSKSLAVRAQWLNRNEL